MAIDLPVAVITGDAPSTVQASALPRTVNLSGAGSTFGTTDIEGAPAVGSSIVTWSWYLDKPPESAAVLINGTTMTPSFVMDVPGMYQARLRVTNNLGVQSEIFGVRIDPDHEPYKFGAPTSAYYITTAALPVSLLVPPTNGVHAYAAFMRAFAMYVEGLGANVASYVESPQFEVYAQAHAGAASANGGRGQPFNPTSAAANGFAGPIEQAIAALEDMDLSAAPARGRTLNLFAGTYNEHIDIEGADTPWTIKSHGVVILATGKRVRHTSAALAVTLSRPDLIISPAYKGSYLQSTSGLLELANTDNTHLLFLTDAVFGAVSIVAASTFAVGPVMYCFGTTTLSGTVNVPNLVLGWCEDTRFGALNIRGYRRLTRPYFSGNVTLAASVFVTDNDAIYDAAFGNNIVFDGPAGVARFDPVTANRFFASGGSFGASGCHTLDYVDQCHRKYAKAPVAMSNRLSSGNMDLGSFLEFGVRAGSCLKAHALCSAVVDAADSYRFGIAISNSTGGTALLLATQEINLPPGSYPAIELDVTVYIEAVGDPGTVSWRGVSTINGSVVSEFIIADRDNTIVDLVPAVCRLQLYLDLNGGSMGAGSQLTLLSMTAQHERGLT